MNKEKLSCICPENVFTVLTGKIPNPTFSLDATWNTLSVQLWKCISSVWNVVECTSNYESRDSCSGWLWKAHLNLEKPQWGSSDKWYAERENNLTEKRQQEDGCLRDRKRALTRNDPNRTLTLNLDVPASRTVRSECLQFKPPRLWYFLIATWLG